MLLEEMIIYKAELPRRDLRRKSYWYNVALEIEEVIATAAIIRVIEAIAITAVLVIVLVVIKEVLVVAKVILMV